MAVIRPEMLPARPMEDQLAGLVPVRVDGRTYRLPVLPRKRNRVWKEELSQELGTLFEQMDSDDPGLLMASLAAADEKVVKLVRAYDYTNLIPPDDEMEADTDAEWLAALLSIVAAAHPFVGLVLSGRDQTPTPSPIPANGVEHTSSPQPPTGGRRGSSKTK